MKMLVRIVSIALVAGGLLATPSTASAAPPPWDLATNPTAYPLTIADSYGCAHPSAEYPDLYPCVTEFVGKTGVWGSDDDRSDAAAMLTSLSSGKRVALEQYASAPDFEDTVEVNATGRLPSGAYELVVTRSKAGRWWCSEFNEDGCSWLEPDEATVRWRFRYRAGTTLRVWPYRAPSTDLAQGRIERRGKRVTITGTLVGRVEQPDFMLAPSRGLVGRRITLQYQAPHGWRTLKSGRTQPGGRVRLVGRTTKAKRYRWRLLVESTTGSPGGYFISEGRLRIGAKSRG